MKVEVRDYFQPCESNTIPLWNMEMKKIEVWYFLLQ